MQKLSYKTLASCQDELIIKKSRFLTFVYGIASEEEAQRILEELRARYRDATHICYAYVIGIGGNIERFSDDGEPSGTAGMPMLEVIKNCGYSEVLAVVVRYFGGIKLGAGGLVRAYAESVKTCIQKASEVEYICSGVYRLCLDYSQNKRINQLLQGIPSKTLQISYNGEGVTLQIASPIEIGFDSLVRDFFAGRVEVESMDTQYICYSQSP